MPQWLPGTGSSDHRIYHTPFGESKWQFPIPGVEPANGFALGFGEKQLDSIPSLC